MPAMRCSRATISKPSERAAGLGSRPLAFSWIGGTPAGPGHTEWIGFGRIFAYMGPAEPFASAKRAAFVSRSAQSNLIARFSHGHRERFAIRQDTPGRELSSGLLDHP